MVERNRRILYRLPLALGVLALILGTLILEGLPPTALAALLDRFQVFVTILL